MKFLNRTENLVSSVDFPFWMICDRVSRRGFVHPDTKCSHLQCPVEPQPRPFVSERPCVKRPQINQYARWSLDRRPKTLSAKRHSKHPERQLLNFQCRRTAARFATRWRLQCHFHRLRHVFVVERAGSKGRLIAGDVTFLRLDWAEDERVALQRHPVTKWRNNVLRDKIIMAAFN